MNPRIFICLIILFTSQIQAQWEWVNPLPQGDTIDGIYFFDESKGYFYTRYNFWFTEDGGESWGNKHISKDRGYISCVYFIDEYIGYLGTTATNPETPLMAKTIDGGKSWIELTLPDWVHSQIEVNFIEDIYFINDTTGYISVNSVLFLTKDDGKNWDLVFTPLGLDMFEKLLILDENNIWIFSNDLPKGAAYTSDGGNNWELFPEIIINHFYPVVQVVDDIVWINAESHLVRSNFDGSSWSKSKKDSLTNFSGISDFHFFNANEGILTCNEGLYITSDSGNTWSKYNSQVLKHIAIINKEFSFGAVLKNKIIKTRNFWQNIDTLTTSFTDGELTSVDYVNETCIYTGGRFPPTLFKSTDGGESWEKNNYIDNANITGIDFYNESDGWLLTDDGRIIITKDGGNNWTEKSISSFALYASYRINQNLGWIVDRTEIYKTTDGGNTFFKLNTPVTNELVSVFFTDSLNGWVGTWDYDNSQFYRTRDGGLSWELVLENVGSRGFPSIQFIDSFNGWTVGFQKVYRTQDGGSSWEEINNDLRRPIDMKFADKNNGWLLIFPSSIYKTSDSGYTWEKQASPVSWLLNEIGILDANHGIAVGSDGQIIKTENGGITELEGKTTYKVIPDNYVLSQNYPNPFNPSTSIQYNLPATSDVTLTIYNMMGQKVRSLKSSGALPGTQSFTWNGTNENNERVASGIYIYRLRAVGNDGRTFSKSSKMMMIK